MCAKLKTTIETSHSLSLNKLWIVNLSNKKSHFFFSLVKFIVKSLLIANYGKLQRNIGLLFLVVINDKHLIQFIVN